MSASPQRRPDNSNKPIDPIVVFREKYADALASAVVSAEHTATDGWARLYLGHQQAQRERRRDMAKELKALAVLLEDSGFTEDDEKALAEIKKASVSLRESQIVFEMDTIGPVREPALICDRLRNEAMNEAARIEHEAPMMHIGLEATMQMEVAGVDKPRWDAATGRIVIEKSGGEIE